MTVRDELCGASRTTRVTRETWKKGTVLMRMMTFNIRFENDQDGANGWAFRRDLVVRVVERYRPVLVGLQEAKWSQITYLRQHLGDYRLHAPGRVVDDICQYPTLFHLDPGLVGRDGGEFWLSKTPATHLSKDWDSAFPRMMSHGLFEDPESGRSLRVVVTHLDHIGVEARLEQGRIIRDWVREHSREPMVVMGDFNDHPGSPVHQLLTADDSGLRDTWQLLGRAEGSESMTCHRFDGIPAKSRLDWILVSAHFAVRDAFIVRDNEDGRYPSDHFPYGADLEWS